MTQFEFDQFMGVASSFEMNGRGKPAEVEAAYLRCASELRDFLRHSATEPDVGGEPAAVPSMRWPSEWPTGLEEKS